MKREFAACYGDLERQHFWHLARRRIVLATLEHFVRAAPGVSTPRRLLDVGCGAGTNLRAFQQLGFDCVGIETDPLLVEQARRTSGVPVWHLTLPLKNPPREQFDVILLLDVLEHVQDDRAALTSLKSLLAPSGVLIINVPAHPHLWSILDEENQHYRRYTRHALAAVLVATGYRISSLRFWGSVGYPLVLIQRRWVWARHPQPYETYIPPQALTTALSNLLWWEFKVTAGFPLPFGVSLLAVANSA
jgi:SAM-dependent methyltransferase